METGQKTKEYVLWSSNDNWEIDEERTKQYYLIDPNEIEEKAIIGSENYFIDQVSEDADELNLALQHYLGRKEEEEENFNCKEEDDLLEFLHSLGFTRAQINCCPEYPDVTHQLAFSLESKKFFFVDEWCETQKVYQYWDGHNFKKMTLFDEVEYEISVTEEEINLDEYNGRNFTTGGTGEHQAVHKILTKDGEQVEDEYLLVYYSEWQGSHTMADILSLDEMEEHLIQMNRDVFEYLPQIESLGK